MCFHLFVSPKSETFPPAWLSSWSHSPCPTHIFFFFYSLVFAFQALCQLFFPRLPTWLLTLSFMIKSENDAFRLFSRLSQQPRLRGCVSSCFCFILFLLCSAISLLEFYSLFFSWQFIIIFFFAKKKRLQEQPTKKDHFFLPPDSWMVDAWSPGLHSRLPDVCRGNVAPLQPNFSSCGFTY